MRALQMYVIVLGSAFLMACLSKLDDLNPDEVASWSWVGYFRFWAFVTLQVIIAWKGLVTDLNASPMSRRAVDIESILKEGERHATQEGKKQSNDQ